VPTLNTRGCATSSLLLLLLILLLLLPLLLLLLTGYAAASCAQASVVEPAMMEVYGIPALLGIVVDDDNAQLLARQLLCKKTSELMTRQVSLMLSTLATLQVPSPPQAVCIVQLYLSVPWFLRVVTFTTMGLLPFMSE
jgi:hypothetical protein